MSGIHERLAALSPEQRALLERRLEQQGIAAPDTASGTKPGRVQAAAEVAFVPKRRRSEAAMDFSLFFFSGDGSTMDRHKYGLLMECAAFADRHGFKAVWTPERHFEEFGGLYPNPSVLSAALAAVTERVELRAGSVVLPLHHPVRFVEEWSVVDNLSDGRVSVAFATGWHPADFILAPVQDPDYYVRRKEELFKLVEQVRALWNGEAVPFTDASGAVHRIKTLPRPIQSELNLWIATNGNEETYRQAAEIGAGILTGILGNGFAELEGKIERYREALLRHGYDPQTKKVAVMLHTCLGENDEAVRAKVERPLKEYLKTFLSQQRQILADYDGMTDADFEAIVSRAFDKYYRESSLLGTPDKCAKLVETLRDIGVGEIACLIDFGVDRETVMESLALLSELQRKFAFDKELIP
ncbi:MupA/Atu3671 family FMN-dependent luciferase-like monooxygenase [Paenibacillus elgii]|uniref:MupA/Atu3671 family FMN-dependent luciferase-like monooxygenase n=1 Tax=Paenibacillus elgii TaxID=189691 RepID=UPI00203F41D3|nr:MupA/Atu3671 family FMN-dependent luciferase-like monooxygenase [Paenibacillus elgii]MCM3267860.1 LLM class flavin-dependent oxidoreductase [Paenibacillus elgii]